MLVIPVKVKPKATLILDQILKDMGSLQIPSQTTSFTPRQKAHTFGSDGPSAGDDSGHCACSCAPRAPRHTCTMCVGELLLPAAAATERWAAAWREQHHAEKHRSSSTTGREVSARCVRVCLAACAPAPAPGPPQVTYN